MYYHAQIQVDSFCPRAKAHFGACTYKVLLWPSGNKTGQLISLLDPHRELWTQKGAGLVMGYRPVKALGSVAAI